MHQLSGTEILTLANFFKVLGDPNRVTILTLLAQKEENVTNLAEALGMEQSAVSHQLKLLRDNRFVVSRREKKSVYYSLNDDHIYQLLIHTIEHIREDEEIDSDEQNV